MEGIDLSQLPMGYFGLPSQNFIIRKGVAYTRPGIQNDGTAPTGPYKITGPYSFKDALSGQQALRCTSDGRVQFKYLGNWITIYSSLTPGHKRVRFAEWVDENNDLVQLRLFFVDGSTNVYSWNGAIGVIKAVQNAGGVITQFGEDPNSWVSGVWVGNSGGYGYNVGVFLRVSGGNSDAILVVETVATGGVGTLAITSPGSGYVVGSVILLQQQGGGLQTLLQVTSVNGGGGVTGVTILVAGNGYQSGQVCTSTLGTTGTTATFTVGNVGNTITSWSLIQAGSGYSAGTNIAMTGGAGNAASIEITGVGGASVVIQDANTLGELTAATMANAGTGYVVNDVLALPSQNGQIAAQLTVASVSNTGAILGFTISINGFGYTYGQTLAGSGGTGSGATFTVLSVGKTIEQLGFDYPNNASGAPDTVSILHFSAPGVLGSITNVSQAAEYGDISLFFNSFGTPPSVDDVIIGAICVQTPLESVAKDEIYNYQGHLAVASLLSSTVYFSDAVSFLDWTVPDADDEVTTSAFEIQLQGNFTAIINRFNPQTIGIDDTQETVCFVSCRDSWTKVVRFPVPNDEGSFLSAVDLVETDSLGALPFMVCDVKGDPLFLAQDFTLQSIISVLSVGKDTFKLLSDEVSDLLTRLDWTEGRLDYTTRYVYLMAPAQSTLILLDMIEEAWQPPQTIPISSLMNISGTLYGNSCVTDETFEMWVGRNDLGAPIESIFAPGYYQGFQLHRGVKIFPQDFVMKAATKMGIGGRMTKSTLVKAELYFENEGTRAKEQFKINGGIVRLYNLPKQQSFGANIFGKRPFGGEGDPAEELWRLYAWRKFSALSWFEMRPIFTVTPVQGSVNQEFHLIGWEMDDAPSEYTIPNELFIPRGTGQD